MVEVPHLDLWKRLDRVVGALTTRGDIETADYLMVGFFIRYPEPEELRRFVEIAEQTLTDLDTGGSVA